MDTNQINKDNKTTVEEKSTVNKTVEKAQDKASEAASEAKRQATKIGDQAKTEAKNNLESQKNVAARELHGVAEALRQTGNNLREQDQTMFAQYSNQMADRVERASTYLEENNVEDFVREAEDFARRQPELFIGGAFTLGLLAARFLKSSAPKYDDYDYNYNYSANYPDERQADVTSPIPYSDRHPYTSATDEPL